MNNRPIIILIIVLVVVISIFLLIEPSDSVGPPNPPPPPPPPPDDGDIIDPSYTLEITNIEASCSFVRNERDLPDIIYSVEWTVINKGSALSAVSIFYCKYDYETRKWGRELIASTKLDSNQSITKKYERIIEWNHYPVPPDMVYGEGFDEYFKIVLNHDGADILSKTDYVYTKIPATYWITPNNPDVKSAVNTARSAYPNLGLWQAVLSYVYGEGRVEVANDGTVFWGRTKQSDYFTHYGWEADQILWGVKSYGAWPHEALEKAGGDCWEEATLSVSMLRSAGYSADGVYVSQSSYHAWTEFWNGDDWVCIGGARGESMGWFNDDEIINPLINRGGLMARIQSWIYEILGVTP